MYSTVIKKSSLFALSVVINQLDFLIALIFISDWRIKRNLRRIKNISASFPVFGRFFEIFFHKMLKS